MNLGQGALVKEVNGDTIIGRTTSHKIKELQWLDQASLSSWYQDDPNKNHLGLIELFTTMADEQLPMYKGFFEDGAVLEVNGVNGTFTYDVPIVKPGGVITVEDTSTYSEAPGIDGTVFPLKLGQPFSIGDVLTYDAMYGLQVIVSEDHEIEGNGDVWTHWVKISSGNPEDYFHTDKLKAGIEYFKIGNALGEYSTQFSSISTPSNTGTMTCEFVLGNHRGVETFYTMYSDKKSYNGAALRSKQVWDEFTAYQERLGTDIQGRPYDSLFVAKVNAEGKVQKSSVRIGSTLEYFVLLELMRIEAHQLLFQKGGIVKDTNGVKRLNEGIFHQYRRGKILKYSRPGGITTNHILQVTAYLFRSNRNMLVEDREIKFKCGKMAYLNMLNIFREEFMSQVKGLGPLLGHQRSLPSSPIKGANLRELEIQPVVIKKVWLPGIGVVEIEHDPSLDYQPLTDKHSSPMTGDGYPPTSYSMVIYDLSDPKYSNATQHLPSGTTLIDGGTSKANVYYVKPQGDTMWWGFNQGRYSPSKASEVISSMKTMGTEFWAHSISAAWVRDITRYLVIELKR